MTTQREDFEAWFKRRRGARDVMAENAILSIVDAYDAMQMSGRLSDQVLEMIIVAAGSSDELTWNCAIDLLAKTIKRWPASADVIAEMMKSDNPQHRFSAICSLGKDMPTKILHITLEAGLIDGIAKVRRKAAERSNDLNQKELISSLESALEREKDGKTHESIELSLRMLRDGYWIRPEPGRRNSIVVRTTTGVASKSITDAEIKSKGIDKIISELRR